jgi:hypothetical protein
MTIFKMMIDQIMYWRTDVDNIPHKGRIVAYFTDAENKKRCDFIWREYDKWYYYNFNYDESLPCGTISHFMEIVLPGEWLHSSRCAQ